MKLPLEASQGNLQPEELASCLMEWRAGYKASSTNRPLTSRVRAEAEARVKLTARGVPADPG